MKLRHEALRILSVIVLAYSLLPAPARAQFFQQGPKLVGTNAVGESQQGYSVSLSGDGNTAIVGGPFDNNQTGAAWVYTRSRDVWNHQGPKLVGTDAVGNAQQGSSVSLSGDGNTVIVGGDIDNHSVGAAWVYTRSGSVWSQLGPKLVGTGVVGLVAQQGWSVALSGDGNTAIVGGVTDNQTAGGNSVGAAWVYTRAGGVWSQQAKLVGTGVVGPNANQGWSVALSGDGNTAIVGGPYDNNQAGAAWVYTRAGGVWSQQGPKLVATDAVGPSVFQGISVSLSGDGNTAIVGGVGDNNQAGAAWVYTRTQGVWTQQGPKLVGTNAVGPSVFQGRSVALSGEGDIAIVGGPVDNNQAGAAWVYTRSQGVWTQLGPKLVGTDAVGESQQGFSVSLSGDGNTAIVGGSGDNGTPGLSIGAAWVYGPFAGTPGQANCLGQSVSALARQYGGLNAAAAALGYSYVSALQNAIVAFCKD